MKFRLVNPYIKGQLETSVDADSPVDAANKCWNTMSSYFTNHLPIFGFSLEGGGKLHHFSVEEHNDNKDVTYVIKPIEGKHDSRLMKRINSMDKELKGGKHEDDDDSSSSSSSEEDIYSHVRNKNLRNQPISWWSYTPAVYSLNTVYMPTFVYPLKPYIEVTYAFERKI